MSNVLVEESSLQDIANAIRAKNGTQNTYKPAQMADAIEAISSGGITPSGTTNIISNGTYDVTNYASAVVNVPTSGGVESGTITGNNTKTISISTTNQCSNVVVLALLADIPTESAWHCMGVIGIAGEHHDVSIYNNNNTLFVKNQPTIIFSANSINISNLKYSTFDGVTYHWYAW